MNYPINYSAEFIFPGLGKIDKLWAIKDERPEFKRTTMIGNSPFRFTFRRNGHYREEVEKSPEGKITSAHIILEYEFVGVE